MNDRDALLSHFTVTQVLSIRLTVVSRSGVNQCPAALLCTASKDSHNGTCQKPSHKRSLAEKPSFA